MSSEELNRILRKTLSQDLNCDSLYDVNRILSKTNHTKRLSKLKNEFQRKKNT